MLKFFRNEQLMLLVILINTLIIFIGGFWPGNTYFEWADAAFTLFFLWEALAKIKADGWRGYWASGWNRFDFIVLLLALPSLANPFVEGNPGTAAILALRSLRMLKAFRLLRFIPNIQQLLNGMRLAFKASFVVVLAFFIFLVVFAVLSSAIFGRIAPEFFGNPGISVYSIFRLFTVEGWYEIPDAVAANGSAAWATFARIFFSVLLFLGGIIGMSLINSLFVDAATSDNNDDVLDQLNRLEAKIDALGGNAATPDAADDPAAS